MEVIFWCYWVRLVGPFQKKGGGKRKEGRVSGNGTNHDAIILRRQSLESIFLRVMQSFLDGPDQQSSLPLAPCHAGEYLVTPASQLPLEAES